ncbi:MAG: MarR family transcriptional regulator [Lachnospiraceae bacterium]|nr:MarR family transcriptional regulator [Lachnospiraceae bacterium]
MPQTEERDIGFLFKQINMQIKKGIDRALMEYDLTTSQSRVLFFIYFREKDKTSMKDIEEHLKVTHPTVIGIVKRLEEKGFVTTASDPEDRRVKLVTITQKTTKMIKKLDQGKRKMDEKLLKGFTEQETKELRRMLSMIEDNLREAD